MARPCITDHELSPNECHLCKLYYTNAIQRQNMDSLNNVGENKERYDRDIGFIKNKFECPNQKPKILPKKNCNCGKKK